MSTELTAMLGAIGVVAILLALILPSLQREIAVIEAQGKTLRNEIEAQGTSLRSEIAAQGREISALRGDVAELRRDVHDLSGRVARIEGTLNMPGRATNGAPEPAGSGAGGDGGVAEGGE